MSQRSFEQVSIRPTGVQTFDQRIGSRRKQHDERSPPIAWFRCNLTGLSQEHNLYFVAYGSDVHVYAPQFPSQAIFERPALIIRCQPSAQGLSGYIDPRHPHHINYLVVQFLGSEETVAAVRDDGDVDLFLVRHVVQAIARRTEPDNSLDLVASEIRPFFQQNVGASAWGLAIHTQARVLAVSSNSREINIFEFGLVQAEGSSGDDADATVTEDGLSGIQRRSDVTHRLLNGWANIPSIAFCNTGDDPQAQWLLTTDVAGMCRSIYLPTYTCVQDFAFGDSAGTRTFDRLHGGWIISYLDRRSFRPVNEFTEALGLETGDSSCGHDKNRSTWDISETIHLLKGATEPFILHPSNGESQASVSSGQIGLSVTVPDAALAQSDHSDSDDEDDIRDAFGEDHAYLDMDLDDFDDDDDQEDGELDNGDNDDDGDDDEGGVSIEHLRSGAFDDPLSPGHDVGDAPTTLSTNSQDDEVVADTASTDANMATADNEYSETSDNIDHSDSDMYDEDWPLRPSLRRREPQFGPAEKVSAHALQCPIFHSSFKNLYLLQPFQQDATGTQRYSPPVVGLASPLKQDVRVEWDGLDQFDRLNIYAEIPSLGVVVVASQKGRAAVLSLTKLPKNASYPAKLKERYRSKTRYAMCLETILPSPEQEKANERPPAPLHGIAVSPLQGSDGSRWRLIMLYTDHSLLSYEIGSRLSAKDSHIHTESLVM